ncbi:MAG: hypothetical protein LBU69_03660, partial [Deltaproteobacteria bacterium]|nr:hypothetical protein [Deltaproteobacteria bacterium]
MSIGNNLKPRLSWGQKLLALAMALALLAISAPPNALFSQANRQPIIIPPEISPPISGQGQCEVEAVELYVDIANQKARVTLRHIVRNTGNSPLELDFLVPLPAGGAVSGLGFVADGKELAGKVYGREEAFKIYQDIVSRLKDPALLEFAGYGLFRARAFPIAKGAKASLDLSLDYLLPKDNGRVDLDFPLANSLTQRGEIGLQDISVKIEGQDIGGVFSLLDGVEIERESGIS